MNTLDLLPFLIVAHLIGDFILQNHWMQTKSKSSYVCTVHVACYALPFLSLALAGWLPAWLLGVILLEHWLQDRFALHLKWMRVYRQTEPSLWPVGPLCVDQAFHIGFIGVLCFLSAVL